MMVNSLAVVVAVVMVYLLVIVADIFLPNMVVMVVVGK
jgi:hypothetical protein